MLENANFFIVEVEKNKRKYFFNILAYSMENALTRAKKFLEYIKF